MKKIVLLLCLTFTFLFSSLTVFAGTDIGHINYERVQYGGYRGLNYVTDRNRYEYYFSFGAKEKTADKYYGYNTFNLYSDTYLVLVISSFVSDSGYDLFEYNSTSKTLHSISSSLNSMRFKNELENIDFTYSSGSRPYIKNDEYRYFSTTIPCFKTQEEALAYCADTKNESGIENVDTSLPEFSESDSSFDKSVGYLSDLKRVVSGVPGMNNIPFQFVDYTYKVNSKYPSEKLFLQVQHAGRLQKHNLSLNKLSIGRAYDFIKPSDQKKVGTGFTYSLLHSLDLHASLLGLDSFKLQGYSKGWVDSENIRICYYDTTSKKWKYGPWTRCTIKDGMFGFTNIDYDTGVIDPDSGEFVPDLNLPNGAVDGSTGGNIEDSFDIDGAVSNFTGSLASFTSFLTNLISSISVFPQFLSQCFSFLPFEIPALLSAVIIICVLTIIVKFIRG